MNMKMQLPAKSRIIKTATLRNHNDNLPYNKYKRLYIALDSIGIKVDSLIKTLQYDR